ncbi:MAG: hypothetical protein QNI91_18950 [Arenicellales bacterium]|nr:hypothetical protein [Arenicellales bacterium]
MSKRGRITLDPDVEIEADQESEAAVAPEPEVHAQSTVIHGNSTRSMVDAAKKMLTTGTIVKTVLAGLAVVSLVILWKNKRP